MPDTSRIYPVLCGNEERICAQLASSSPRFITGSCLDFDSLNACFGIALHMHQPTIPASTDDVRAASLISNLSFMLAHPEMGDNHNAPVFLRCYERMSDFMHELVKEHKHPRIMLDYSGNLLWGLQEIEHGRVIKKLKAITGNTRYQPHVEWLGTMWSHAVVSSTPVPDIRLHIRAWQENFASLFGFEALGGVRGFSAPEMHLPIHPDVCFEYVKTLKECGYRWLMVQEHTVENLDGSRITRPHLPHRLIARNSQGQQAEIAALIKTQGSDTKLVGQMQPYYEAKSIRRQVLAGKSIPPFVVQISDGENGGVIMNEFPPKYLEAYREIGTSGVVGMNGSEYLEWIQKQGIEEKDFIPLQPVSQHRIWQAVDSLGPGAADAAIEKIKASDRGFHLDKASWTNDRNWVRGYENVLDPVNQLSAAFHERFDNTKQPEKNPAYKKALLYLLLSQTSCFRYWGQGIWTEYAREICRRGREAIEKG